MSERLEKIAVLDNEVEARVLDAILTERGIPHVMRSYYSTPYDGLFQTGSGWGHVEAPPDLGQDILAILDDMLEAVPTESVSEDEDDESDPYEIAEEQGQRQSGDDISPRILQAAIAGAVCAGAVFLAAVVLWLADGMAWRLSYIVTEPHLVGVLGLRLCWGVILSLTVAALLLPGRSEALYVFAAAAGAVSGPLAILALMNLPPWPYGVDGGIGVVAYVLLAVGAVASIVFLKFCPETDEREAASSDSEAAP